MRHLLIYLLLIVFIISVGCRKKPYHDDDYMEMYANGNYHLFQRCESELYGGGGGGSAYLEVLGDSSIFISAGCDNYAGFIIKGHSTGTYPLNDLNRAIYPEHYVTDSLHTGTISITFYSNYAEGRFTYSAIDTSSRQVVNITNGYFHLPLQ